MAEEMTVLPGMDEVGSLLWIAEHHDLGRFDVIVVDAAPTGETLRLLSLPEAGRWWMEKIEPLGRRISKLTGPIIQRVVGRRCPAKTSQRHETSASSRPARPADRSTHSVRVVRFGAW
jgi:arsenite-transporting ATPase